MALNGETFRAMKDIFGVGAATDMKEHLEGTVATVTDTLTMDSAVLSVTGATGTSEFRLTDNLADALSIKITSGNDLITFTTTNSAESVNFPNSVLFTGTVTFQGDAGSKYVLTLGATNVTETLTVATGEYSTDLTDNLADAWSIKIASGNDLVVFRTTNSDEAVQFPNNVEFFGDSGTKKVVSVSATSVAETVTTATGEYETRLTDNLADAWSIKIASGNDFLVFQSTNSAEAVLVANTLASTPPANQTLTNGNTITLPTGCVKVVDNGGAVTGIILTAGTVDGQILHIVNAAAASVTFAAAGTSNVADGTSAVIDANRAISLVWDAGSSKWYRTG